MMGANDPSWSTRTKCRVETPLAMSNAGTVDATAMINGNSRIPIQNPLVRAFSMNSRQPTRHTYFIESSPPGPKAPPTP